MNQKEQILFDCLNKLISATEDNMLRAKELNEKIQHTSEALDERSLRLKRELIRSIEDVISVEIAKSVEDAKQSMEQTKKDAESAARFYSQKSRGIVSNMWIVGVVVFFSTIITNALVLVSILYFT